MNAYIGARMAGYFRHLERGAAARGLRAQVLSTKSNGGVMTAARRQEPVQTLLSGPASGVIGAAHVARLAGAGGIVTLDMGGTSADVAIVVDGHPAYSTENQVGDFPVIMPAVDVSSIGAGGGSIAWTDAAGILKVGPRSAGADPGPACYGRGGQWPTVTDAPVHLGIIAPDRFLGGKMPLAASLRREQALTGSAGHWAVVARDGAGHSRRGDVQHVRAVHAAHGPERGGPARFHARCLPAGAGPHRVLLAREVGIEGPDSTVAQHLVRAQVHRGRSSERFRPLAVPQRLPARRR